MRFESLLWSLLSMFLVVGAAWEEQSLVGGATTEDSTFAAADSGSDVPPPRP